MNKALCMISSWATVDARFSAEHSLSMVRGAYDVLPICVEERIRECVRLAEQYENRWWAVPFPGADPRHPPFWIKRNGRTFTVSTGTRTVGRFTRQKTGAEAYASVATAIETAVLP